MRRRGLLSRLARSAGRLLPPRFRAASPVVPVVRLSGVIGSVLPLRTGLSLASCAGALQRAFETPGARAVALIVNSPGGSAVQSHLIYRRVRDLAEETKLPVLIFTEDAAASGGYMLACAGDEIFADPFSFIGSIGVLYASFGFERLMDRIGVERRIHATGDAKAMLDPFRPEQAGDVARLREMQARVHEGFVALVQQRRGARLAGDPAQLFSGAVFTGTEALRLGLVDGLGDLRSVLRERYGAEVDLRLIPLGRGAFLGRLFGQPPPLETAVFPEAVQLLSAIEQRALWARFGL